MKIAFLVILFSFFGPTVYCQPDTYDLVPDSTSVQKRKKAFVIGTLSSYTASSVGLYFAWYKNYDQESFHLYNDWGEWNNIDKLGHSYAAYFQTDLLYQMSRWSGHTENQALKLSCLTSLGFQTAFEIMDGFSSRWGFSVPDIAANIFGTGSFYLQQKLWHDQRVRLKFSYWPVSYSEEFLTSETGIFNYTLKSRATALYGDHFLERMVKDYNGQTIWLSANLKSFLPNSNLPPWLNIAVGFGSGNLYGGFDNMWELNDENIIVPPDQSPRLRQYVISPDIDFSRIKTNSPFVRTLFSLLNAIKLPAPSLVLDSQGNVSMHLFYLN